MNKLKEEIKNYKQKQLSANPPAPLGVETAHQIGLTFPSSVQYHINTIPWRGFLSVTSNKLEKDKCLHCRSMLSMFVQTGSTVKGKTDLHCQYLYLKWAWQSLPSPLLFFIHVHTKVHGMQYHCHFYQLAYHAWLQMAWSSDSGVLDVFLLGHMDTDLWTICCQHAVKSSRCMKTVGL